jgi:putative holliday junction resolvase
VRPGVRLGVDVGSVRVGVAASDPAGVLASPVATLRRGRGDLAELARLAGERAAVEVVVGLPRTLRGQEGAAAADAVAFAQRLVDALPGTSVRLVDERLSTVTAQNQQRASGLGTRRGRTVVDQAAAAIILQSALDEERATGEPPGREVVPLSSRVEQRPPEPDVKVEE